MIDTLPCVEDSTGLLRGATMGPSGRGDSTLSVVSRSDALTIGMRSPSATPGFIERVQAKVRPDEQYREEIVKSIFGEVGTPVEGECIGCLASVGGPPQIFFVRH